MATNTIARGRTPRRTKQVPVRNIGDDDIRSALRQGLDDFKTFRGDIVFAGLIYTVLGLAAVVMTTSMPLIPFFLPVVAGVGLLGPVAAVGFYELADRRESGESSLHWFNFLDVRKRRTVDDMGMVAGLLLAIFFLWLIAAGALYGLIFGWTTPATVGDFLSMVFTTPKGWALIISAPSSARSLAGSCLRSASSRFRCSSTATLRREKPSPRHGAQRTRTRARWSAGASSSLYCSCSARSRCSSDSPSSYRGSAIRHGTSTRASSTGPRCRSCRDAKRRSS